MMMIVLMVFRPVGFHALLTQDKLFQERETLFGLVNKDPKSCLKRVLTFSILKVTLKDFTLPNARRFYLSMGGGCRQEKVNLQSLRSPRKIFLIV